MSILTGIETTATASAAPASDSVIGAIRHASAKSGVDFNYLLQKASTESSLNPAAKAATSSASGLFQFIDQTWLQEMSAHGAEYGMSKEAAAVNMDSSGHASVADPAMRQHIMSLKNDPEAASEMAAAFTKDNRDYLQASVGGKIGGTELYLAHFLGAGGATKFLTSLRADPSQSGAALMPQAADANEPVFYHADGSARTLGEIYNRFAAKFSGSATQINISAGTKGAASVTDTASSPTLASIKSSASTEIDWHTPGRASLYEMLILSQLNATQHVPGRPGGGKSL